MARLGPILGRIPPPPPGGPGEAPGGHFWTFLGRPSRDLKNELLFVVFHICGVFFLCYYLPSVVFLAPWLAASCICKTLKIHWFLWVASHMRLVLATPEAVNFQWGRVINIGEKKSSKKGLTGPENKVKKGAFLRPKWLPKWTPEASRNVCTRRSATEAAKTPLGAPQERHQTILERFSSHTGIQGLSGDYPAHLISPTWAPGSAQLSKKST